MSFFTKGSSDRRTRGIVKHVYIFLLYALIMFLINYLATNWPWLWTMLGEKCRKKHTLPCKKRLTKTQELWTNTWCHHALCYGFL